MKTPETLKYSKDHEWAKEEKDLVTVGITDFAQNALGDVVFVELPKIGAKTMQGKAAAVVESVKSVSDIYAPASGEVAEINEDLIDTPELINKDPYGKGWILKIKPSDKNELNRLMNAADYQKHTASGKH
ncbi:Glycine cleavage system H protein [uncultured archaeon]|nr:Glycine cleavage system H protein [uncultured archaeon]